MRHAFAALLETFTTASGLSGQMYSLPALTAQFPGVARMPMSLRIVLESLLRHCDGQKVTIAHVAELANWAPQAQRTQEIPFVVARVVLQDFTGVPLLADLAAMRSAAVRMGADPLRIEPLVPVDLVVDHSITVDFYGSPSALDLNMQLEFQRNHERYAFMKWGMQAFETFRVVPPGFGIVHQVNLEYLARGVHQQAALPEHDPLASAAYTPPPIYYPDTLVGTDSHTTMVNGIGVVAWGVGGIEAEAAMLGQPVYLLMPDVVGMELTGRLREGVTATDLVLTLTELLRRHKVVGQFVEFFGEGTRTLPVPDRATIANMAPEYGATMGFFPVDDKTLTYFEATGRSRAEIELLQAYFQAQGLFGVPVRGQVDYSRTITLDLGSVTPSVAGPKRPQDRMDLGQVPTQFASLFSKPSSESGFNQPAERLLQSFAVEPSVALLEAAAAEELPLHLRHGDILIAAITSCTNTSNPSVLLAAGLLAKKAVQAGLRVAPHIKTSLAPGSRIVTEYLSASGLLPYLEQLGFSLAGYGCTTCIGNSGDLRPEFNATIIRHDLVCAAVLSGNRNFEARIHPNLKANFLASPPLVVAYAIAGNVLCDLMTQPLGQGPGPDGQLRDVFLGDIWPSSEEIAALMHFATNGAAFRASYAQIRSQPGELWEAIVGAQGPVYTWPASTYIAQPPFFQAFAQPAASPLGAASAALPLADWGDLVEATALDVQPPAAAVPHVLQEEGAAAPRGPGVYEAKIMALFGDSVTTDHISPAGAIAPDSPAGQWLLAHGVSHSAFNSYGARRGNHEVMLRGTFANVRIKNRMLPVLSDGSQPEGGITLYQGQLATGQMLPIFDAAMRYKAEGIPTVVFAGEEYGTGSSRDWAAKGTQLLGIAAVVAQSFERIHRSNLVGMGVLPLQFQSGQSWQSLGLRGTETIDILPDPQLTPQSQATLLITRADGSRSAHTLLLRIDTPIEVAYYRAGGILPFVLRQLLA